MSRLRTLDDLDVTGRRVFLRADLNVPMKDGAVTDATRIARTVPTIVELADRGARVIVASHLGRPKGKAVAALSLAPVAEALGDALDGRSVVFATDCVGEAAERVVGALRDGDIALLENLRFHGGEEANDAVFAGRLAALADLYVNDAFSCAHRAHASTEFVARLLPGAAGRLMAAELAALSSALEAPEHPVAALVGGAKVSTKLAVLGNITGRVDQVIIGGAMANTFLHAIGTDVGNSLCERDMAAAARNIMDTAATAGCEIVLPIDAMVAESLAAGVETLAVEVAGVPAQGMILDVGPQSVDDLTARLAVCRTLLWNGPLGAFEVPPFDAGTNAVARAAARLTGEGRLRTVAGGGDTVAALAHAGVLDDFSYVSTAGGAFLEWLEGRTLPGVAVLERGN